MGPKTEGWVAGYLGPEDRFRTSGWVVGSDGPSPEAAWPRHPRGL